jgi:hypothetical protein
MIDHPPLQLPLLVRDMPADPLQQAIATISRSFGGVDAARVGSTPVTRFRASYAQVLKEVDQGQPQVVVQGSRRFVVFSEEQVVAFADLHGKDQTVGDLLQGLPLLGVGTAPIRADMPEPAHDAYALGARA